MAPVARVTSEDDPKPAGNTEVEGEKEEEGRGRVVKGEAEECEEDNVKGTGATDEDTASGGVKTDAPGQANMDEAYGEGKETGGAANTRARGTSGTFKCSSHVHEMDSNSTPVPRVRARGFLVEEAPKGNMEVDERTPRVRGFSIISFSISPIPSAAEKEGKENDDGRYSNTPEGGRGGQGEDNPSLSSSCSSDTFAISLVERVPGEVAGT